MQTSICFQFCLVVVALLSAGHLAIALPPPDNSFDVGEHNANKTGGHPAALHEVHAMFPSSGESIVIGNMTVHNSGVSGKVESANGTFGPSGISITIHTENEGDLVYQEHCETSNGSPTSPDIFTAAAHLLERKGQSCSVGNGWYHCENKESYGTASVGACGLNTYFPCEQLGYFAQHTAYDCRWPGPSLHAGAKWVEISDRPDWKKNSVIIYHA